MAYELSVNSLRMRGLSEFVDAHSCKTGIHKRHSLLGEHKFMDAIDHGPASRASLLTKGLVVILALIGLSFPSPSGASDKPDGKTTTTPAKVTAPSTFPTIKIKNFGRMDDNFFRGAQPKSTDYKALAVLGIKTIVDLRDDPTAYEKPNCEAAGMRYVNIPMSDSQKPPDEQIVAFFAVADDTSNWPFYVHCAGGRHRTGLIGAVYRFNKYGWDFDQAYQEMKNYDYYSRWGHEAIKDFVREYHGTVKPFKPLVPVALTDVPSSQPTTPPPLPQLKE